MFEYFFSEKFRYFQKENTFPVPFLGPFYNRTVFGIRGKCSNVGRGSERREAPAGLTAEARVSECLGENRRERCVFSSVTPVEQHSGNFLNDQQKSVSSERLLTAVNYRDLFRPIIL